MSTSERISTREKPQRSHFETPAKSHEGRFSCCVCYEKIYAFAHKILQCFKSRNAVLFDERGSPARRDTLTHLSDASLKNETSMSSIGVGRADSLSEEEQHRQRSLSAVVSDLGTRSSSMQFDQSGSFTSISFQSISSIDDSTSKNSSPRLDQSVSSASFQSYSDIAESIASYEEWICRPKCVIEKMEQDV